MNISPFLSDTFRLLGTNSPDGCSTSTRLFERLIYWLVFYVTTALIDTRLVSI